MEDSQTFLDKHFIASVLILFVLFIPNIIKRKVKQKYDTSYNNVIYKTRIH